MKYLWDKFSSVQFSSVAQSGLTLCHPRNRSMPGLLSITNSRSPPKPMSIEWMMPFNHLILCCPLLLLPSIFPSIRVLSFYYRMLNTVPHAVQFSSVQSLSRVRLFATP